MERKEAITRKQLIKTIIFSVGAAAIGYGAKQLVDTIDDQLKPQYINRGFPAPYNEPEMPWQRVPDWKKR